MPLTETSIAGYAALSGQIVNVADAYHLPAGSPYKISRSFDEKSGYRTKSMLVVPMRDHQDDGHRRRPAHQQEARPQDRPAAGDPRGGDGDPLHLRGRGAGHLAGQPGRGGLREHPAHPGHQATSSTSFVRASVTAIESRDPTTSGHSDRVATLTVGLAEKLDALDHGAVPGRALHPRPAPGDPLREPAARLRQGRRAREGPDQGQEALRGRDAGDPPALRLHQAHAGGRAPARQAGADPGRARRARSCWRRWTAPTSERQRRSTSSCAWSLQANEPTILEEESFRALMDLHQPHLRGRGRQPPARS